MLDQRVSRISQILRGILFLGPVVMLMGCYHASMYPQGVERSTAAQRCEVEFIAQADLAVVHTSQSDRGKLAYRRGERDLVVITHITSMVNQSSKEFALPPEDRYVERLWLVLPTDAVVGTTFDLEDLQLHHLAAYDRQDPKQDFYKRSFSVRGKLTIQSIENDVAIIALDLQVRPTYFNQWKLKDILSVPITQEGRYAHKVDGQQMYEFKPALLEEEDDAF